MARQRFIWPSLWADPTLGSMSEAHVLLYIACFSLADDHGRLRGDPRFLKGSAWTYRSTSPARLRKMRDDLADQLEHFHVYEDGGEEYIAFLNWNDFQKPKYPTASKLPPPFPEDSPRLPLRVGLREVESREVGLEEPTPISNEARKQLERMREGAA